MNSSKKLAKVPKTIPLAVIEIDKNDAKPLGTTKELRSAILSLGGNLGFEELLRRMRMARSMLDARLRQPSEDENRWQLRALIDAYGFVERQMKLEIGRPVEEPREAFADERAEYERLAKYVEIIGRDTQAN